LQQCLQQTARVNQSGTRTQLQARKLQARRSRQYASCKCLRQLLKNTIPDGNSCGARPGASPAHLAAARSLAKSLHQRGLNLVYGGGTVGIMGEVAKTLVSLSGPQAVHGIIPEALLKFERENKIDEDVFGRTTVVQDMHDRKHKMAEEVVNGGVGGGFIALSGGYGTLEELMEVVTWNQLGIHAFPVVLYNVEGYWDGILQWVTKAVNEEFIAKDNKSIMVEARTSDEVIERLRDYQNSEGRFKLQWDHK
jgi:uncharacterized protein (TIGR00730 family)